MNMIEETTSYKSKGGLGTLLEAERDLGKLGMFVAALTNAECTEKKATL